MFSVVNILRGLVLLLIIPVSVDIPRKIFRKKIFSKTQKESVYDILNIICVKYCKGY